MVTLTILTICFLTALSFKIKKVKWPVALALTWYIHLVFLFFTVICLFLMINGYGFKGTQTERVFFTLYAGSGMILYGLSKPGTDARYAYLLLLFGFPFILLVGLIIPPFRIFALVATLTLLSDSDFRRYTIDDDHALQSKTSGILSATPTYSLITDKYWFFEEITPDVINPKETVKNLRLTKKGTDSVRVQWGYGPMRKDTLLVLE
ncbi:hypothetical protein [Chitinophaga qingshengii]|uniref:Uncharacterized protein n=1 Tax=Chitinophaga qingshengii TaxID=1569794 RepID=A0ABR7TL73_9BACT|nr:hypothetical protein [Chitinophaga qingshengii]MBC9930237.1 hypothetical protein [Chitinophaga qingshengii]